MRTSSIAAALVVLSAAVAEAQWSTLNFVDEFGDVADRGAASVAARPTRPMAFPYGDVTARIFVNCDRAWIRFTEAPTDRVVELSPLQIQRRFTAAARAAGIEARLTAHSGRVGLASELTARGASTTEVMLAGNWRTARMVAHYSAGATAERGAVAKYL